MIRSMTGFGTARTMCGGVPVTVEIRSVNSRYLDYKYKGLQDSNGLGEKIRQQVQKVCQRGRVEVTLRINSNSNSVNGVPVLDKEKYKSFLSILDTIRNEYGQKINISDIIDIRDVLQTTETLEIDESSILSAVGEALDELVAMRSHEGELLSKDIISRLAVIESYCKKIEKLYKESVSRTKNEYVSRILDLMESVPIDETRVLQEAAILADKLDITEECIRFKSHLSQFGYLLNSNDPVGKKLNFLLQEINREVNTIGAKTNYLEITQTVIEIKDEVEKIKEQVQNIL